ncbi:hypothetical protein R1flu_014878 [Riccia fluitans]|uniref:E2F/DP family winged-helix DNA-binding domain-containing protein n=1 Tax=Riccia fluitans TaxID=41844 RepID=A0ABD1YKH3_9MARC
MQTSVWPSGQEALARKDKGNSLTDQGYHYPQPIGWTNRNECPTTAFSASLGPNCKKRGCVGGPESTNFLSEENPRQHSQRIQSGLADETYTPSGLNTSTWPWNSSVTLCSANLAVDAPYVCCTQSDLITQESQGSSSFPVENAPTLSEELENGGLSDKGHGEQLPLGRLSFGEDIISTQMKSGGKHPENASLTSLGTDSDAVVARLQPNPLRQFAGLVKTKLQISQENFCSIQQGQRSAKTISRRIYDVVNVCEGAGVMERAVLSGSAKKEVEKVSGKLTSTTFVRWRNPQLTESEVINDKINQNSFISEQKRASYRIRNRMFEKQKILLELEKEIELLEFLQSYNQMRAAKCPDSSSTSAGIELQLPFRILKASKRSDGNRLDVTYVGSADQCAEGYQVAISSDFPVDVSTPTIWKSIVQNMMM